MPSHDKMKMEVWIDIICPFCYIGCQTFESVLEGFDRKEDVNIVWKSYQINPSFNPRPGQSLVQVMTERGFTLQQASSMNAHAADLAKKVGITLNLSKVIPANTEAAHGLLSFSKAYGKQAEVKRKLFAAYFTEGENIADITTLIEIGEGIGLAPSALQKHLEEKRYQAELREDLLDAHRAGLTGVPFFLLKGGNYLSGAESPASFKQALERAHADWLRSRVC